MTKLQLIEKQAKSYNKKRIVLNVLQCAALAVVFTMPAWAYFLD